MAKEELSEKKAAEIEKVVNCFYQNGFDFFAMSQETYSLVTEAFLQRDEIVEGSERPDVIFHNDTICAGVECFDFDSSLNKERAGSILQINQKKNSADSEANTPINGSYSSSFKTEAGKEYYLQNFLRSFRSHAKKIDAYKENMMRLYPNRKRYVLCFFSEDASALPNLQLKKTGPAALWPFNIKEIVSELKATKGLDLFVEAQYGGVSQKIAYASSKKDYKNLIKKAVEYKKINFVASDTCHSISFSHFFPSGEGTR
jgi:hypothetical protein